MASYTLAWQRKCAHTNLTPRSRRWQSMLHEHEEASSVTLQCLATCDHVMWRARGQVMNASREARERAVQEMIATLSQGTLLEPTAFKLLLDEIWNQQSLQMTLRHCTESDYLLRLVDSDAFLADFLCKLARAMRESRPLLFPAGRARLRLERRQDRLITAAVPPEETEAQFEIEVTEESLDAARTFVRRYPGSSNGWLQLGYAFRARGETAKAAAAFESCRVRAN
eukprot:2802834-Prymnesium_polylepis.1